MPNSPMDTALSRRSFIARSAAMAAGMAWAASGDGPTLGATNSPTARSASRPMPPADRPLTIYSWSDAREKSIIPMSWQPATQVGPAVILVRPMPGIFAGSLADIIANGPAIDRWRDWMQSYFRRLSAKPRRIVLDEEESGIGWWMLPAHSPNDYVAVFQSIWDNPKAYAKLPAKVKGFRPEDFATQFNRGREAVIAWNEFATQIKNDALRRIVYEPAIDAFGPSVEVSNFGDLHADFAVYDQNGWPAGDGLMGNWSSPVAYLINSGNRYHECRKPIIWNNFIDGLNSVRSCVNMSWRVSPWVSYPNYHEGQCDLKPLRALWAELIDHLKASGIRDFLYWNPTEATKPDNNSYAAGIFARNISIATADPFQPIQLDADEIRTGDKVTRFADWIKTGK